MLAALMARLHDLQLAEDSLQEAMASAVVHWSRSGVPASPMGWLLQVAWRKALDHFRQARAASGFEADMRVLAGEEAFEDTPEEIPDERLRLIFICCHPALEPKSQVALTLRTLAGLSTREIARAYLDQEATMGQRLSRAKAKIAAARIPCVVPERGDWPQRLQAVLTVVYLIFNAGYSAGPEAGRDLAEEAIHLARMLERLRPGDAEIEGCLALLVIIHARRHARVDARGVTVALGQQDRTLWSRPEIDAGLALLDRAVARQAPGPYQIKAAIAACHCESGTPDWPQIAALYGSLLRHESTPVVRLNRAVALAEAGALDAALQELAALQAALEGYQPFHAALAALLARKGQLVQAGAAYRTAIALAPSAADAAFLEARLQALAMPPASGPAH
jgi:RNA polymerase sigma-70 factor (ECF subfamily)